MVTNIRNKTRCLLLLLLFNIVLEVLAKAIRLKKRNKRNVDWKGRCKRISISPWHDFVHKSFKKPTYQLELINELSKFAGYKVNIQKSIVYLYTSNFKKFIYLFLAALGLCCCAWAFSSCGERGLLFVVVHGLLSAVASLVAEHGL